MSARQFAIPVDCSVKTKEAEKLEKYLDLARELKNLWNSRTLRTISQNFEKRMGVTRKLRKNLNCRDHSSAEIET